MVRKSEEEKEEEQEEEEEEEEEEEWEEIFNKKKNKPFWKHRVTGEKTWRRPPSPTRNASPKRKSEGGAQHQRGEGRGNSEKKMSHRSADGIAELCSTPEGRGARRQ